MNRNKVDNFSGGYNDALRPELIPDNTLQDIVNMEYDNSNTLVIRKDTRSLASKGLGGVFNNTALEFEVWYPEYMPKNSSGDYVIFGIEQSGTTSDVVVFIAYPRTDGSWVRAVPSIPSGIEYTTSSEFNLFISPSNILLSEKDNLPIRLTIDKNGNIEFKNIGRKNPIEPPVLSYINDSEDDLIETDKDSPSTRIESGQIIQAVYTYIDNRGNESNPSPIGTLFSQNIGYYPNATYDVGYKYFVEKFRVSGMSSEEEGLTKKIYIRNFNTFSPGGLPSFVFVKEVSGDTTIIQEEALGANVAYDNNESSRVVDSQEYNNRIFVGGVDKNRLSLPYEFDFVTPIKIENDNSFDYTNINVWIELTTGAWSGNDNTTQVFDSPDNLRVYASDLITPCKVAFRIISSNRCSLVVQVPELSSSLNNKIYLCYKSSGVTGISETNAPYDYTSTSEAVKLKNTDLFSIYDKPISEEQKRLFTGRKDRGLIEIPDYFDNTRTIEAELQIAQKTHYIIDPYGVTIPIYIYSSSKLIGTTSPIELYNGGNEDCIVLVLSTDNPPCRTQFLKDGSVQNISSTQYLHWYFDIEGYGISRFLSSPSSTSYNRTTVSPGFYFNRSDSDDGVAYQVDVQAGEVADIMLSITIPYYDNAYPSREVFVDSVLSGYHLFNSSIVGSMYNRDGDNIINQGIELEDTINNTAEFNGSRYVGWSKAGKDSFPSLYEKELRENFVAQTVLPYTIDNQYGSSIIYFTRNTITRFTLEGDDNTWADRSDNLIYENSQYGLFAPKSLINTNKALFWFSEVGICTFDRNGIRNISKDRIDIPIYDGYLGEYIPIKEQYILHDNSSGVTYVYDINRDVFIKFTGLEIQFSSVLDFGSTEANKNLFVNNNNEVVAYPDDIEIQTGTEIKTKKFNVDNVKYIRVRARYKGNNALLRATVYNRDDTIDSEFTINNGQWYYLNPGSWGDFVEFFISGIDDLKSLTFDIERRV